jgi:hypothetical protein
LFFTPSGKARSPGSFLPWMIGKRQCFGKYLSITMGRVVTSMIIDAFEFSLEKEHMEKDKPINDLLMTNPLLVTIKPIEE